MSENFTSNWGRPIFCWRIGPLLSFLTQRMTDKPLSSTRLAKTLRGRMPEGLSKLSGQWRERLPSNAVSFKDIGIWSVLKQAIGKDLTRITIPIVYCEPLSFLQRLAEYLEYYALLSKASKCTDTLSRFEYITAFVMSTLSSNNKRMTKPFNPLLFETYELDRREQEGYRFVAEQVSHHPPVSAFHVEASNLEFSGTVSPRIRFWGVSVEIQTGGNFSLKLPQYNEIYTWDSVNCSIQNIIFGDLRLVLEGTIQINSLSGIQAKIKIGKDGSQLFEGYIYKSDEKVKAFYGDWAKFMATCSVTNFEKKYKKWFETMKALDVNADEDVNNLLIDGSTVLWQSNPRPANSEKMYNFTNFTFLLNDPAFKFNNLPKTDSRFRPDIRLLEENLLDEAAEEKNRLEVKQREARENEEKNSIERLPRWFVKTKTKQGKIWLFNRKYWEHKMEYSEDIFCLDQ
uniref:Oxysterol-binding protein n=1 Tax=Syphacia muris TaxID=451379 RepID=A0A158R3V9_9BILA